MLKLLFLCIVQSICLSSGQISLKLAMQRTDTFSWSWHYFGSLFSNWWFLVVGLTMGGATVLWLHILKNYPLSIAYPLTSLSYVFGMIGAWWIFHEAIPLSRWIGVAIIIIGIYFIIK